MTRKVDEFEQPLGDEHYKVRHQWWPKSLDEQDVEWARQERIQAVRAARVANRGRP